MDGIHCKKEKGGKKKTTNLNNLPCKLQEDKKIKSLDFVSPFALLSDMMKEAGH
jgi:hypothetical protein